MFLLVLENDGACTGLNGHCARESAVLVLLWCYKSRGDREQDIWRCWLKAALSSGVTSLQVMVVSARSVSSGSNEAVTLLYLVSSPSTRVYREKTGFKTYWLSRLTRIHIDVADSSVLPFLFLYSLCILSGCPIINICICHQDRKLSSVGPIQYHPHSLLQTSYLFLSWL